MVTRSRGKEINSQLILLRSIDPRSNELMKLAQLHLRDLIWILLVVGLILGWCLDHRRLAPYVPAHHHLMKQFSAVYEALADEGVDVFIDPTTQKVTLVKSGMGKQRWDAHLSRIDQEISNLPVLEIDEPSSP